MCYVNAKTNVEYRNYNHFFLFKLCVTSNSDNIRKKGWGHNPLTYVPMSLCTCLKII